MRRGGLLGMTPDQVNMLSGGLLGVGSAMAQAAQPTPYPVSFGARLAQGLAGAGPGIQQAKQQGMMERQFAQQGQQADLDMEKTRLRLQAMTQRQQDLAKVREMYPDVPPEEALAMMERQASKTTPVSWRPIGRTPSGDIIQQSSTGKIEVERTGGGTNVNDVLMQVLRGQKETFGAEAAKTAAALPGQYQASRRMQNDAELLLDNFMRAEQSGFAGDMLADLRTGLARFGASIGMDLDPETLSDIGSAETTKQLANRFALQVRSPDGPFGGMPGAVSNRDIQFLQDSIARATNTREAAMRFAAGMAALADMQRASVYEIDKLVQAGEQVPWDWQVRIGDKLGDNAFRNMFNQRLEQYRAAYPGATPATPEPTPAPQPGAGNPSEADAIERQFLGG